MESNYKTKFLDYDARPRPKSKRFCVKCQKDIKAGKLGRLVYLIGMGELVLHPSELGTRQALKTDYGYFLIGLDCAKQLGLEWSIPESPF